MALPYPHTRDDCEICRESDADVQILGEPYERPGKRSLLLCRDCPGGFAALKAISDSGEGIDQPVTLTLAVAPGRRSPE